MSFIREWNNSTHYSRNHDAYNLYSKKYIKKFYVYTKSNFSKYFFTKKNSKCDQVMKKMLISTMSNLFSIGISSIINLTELVFCMLIYFSYKLK
jgi:hypothetical protein